VTQHQPSPDIIPADLSALPGPVLCVVIDTEEEFDWNAPFARANTRVEALDWLEKGHQVFRRHGVQPVYLMDYPIATAARARAVFGPWLEAGECLVGTQLHPWVNPPFEEVVCPYHSFPCNLPPALERQKLAALTDAVIETLGVRPTIYKAGRYGLRLDREAMLTDLGYLIDTSVVPNRSFAGNGGGPDFYGYPERPFWSDAARRLLYLPVSQSLVGPLSALARGRWGRVVFGPAMSALHLPGILARTHLLERIMLTPEGTSLPEMCRLAEAQLRAGAKVFMLSLHSPSFMPGGTPYVASRRDVDALLGRLDGFLEHFLGRMGGSPITPPALRDLILGAVQPPDTLAERRLETRSKVELSCMPATPRLVSP
jgi:hypothetical protein